MTSRRWWITGASRGLGRALAEAVAARGDLVLASGRDRATLPTGAGLVPLAVDVRDTAAVTAAAEQLVAEHGGVDVVVSCAGHGLVGAVEECSDDDLATILDTHVGGAARLARAVLPTLRAQGSGHVAVVSSTGGAGAMPLLGAYNAAKWGLEGLASALAAEVAPDGIRVSIVEPGSIDTSWGTSSMAFAAAVPAYDALREQLFGTREVPWPTTGSTGGGTSPGKIAATILRHVDDPTDGRLRVLAGDDAPGQVAAALGSRLDDLRRDPRFAEAFDGVTV
jgi:NAD(P)-dependent dehydrogenase (short-subunit alcohol dehydrogenase family)